MDLDSSEAGLKEKSPKNYGSKARKMAVKMTGSALFDVEALNPGG